VAIRGRRASLHQARTQQNDQKPGHREDAGCEAKHREGDHTGAHDQLWTATTVSGQAFVIMMSSVTHAHLTVATGELPAPDLHNFLLLWLG
jgi:hypothetical protein